MVILKMILKILEEEINGNNTNILSTFKICPPNPYFSSVFTLRSRISLK